MEDSILLSLKNKFGGGGEGGWELDSVSLVIHNSPQPLLLIILRYLLRQSSDIIFASATYSKYY